MSLAVSFLGVLSLWRYAEGERSRAEAQKTHAEADLEVATEALGGFIELSRVQSPFRATAASRLSVISLLEKFRKLGLELAARRPDHVTIHRRLAQADFHLACLLLEQKKRSEARPLLLEALRSWNKILEQSPRDVGVLSEQVGIFALLAKCADDEGNTRESANFFSRAVDLEEIVLRLRPELSVVFNLADHRWSLAILMENLGDHERARSLIEANARMLDNAPAAARNPELVIRRVLAHDQLRRFHVNSTSSTSTVGPMETDDLARLLSSEADRMSDQVWAERFARVLRSTTADKGASPTLEVEAVDVLADFLAGLSAEQRRIEKFEEARRTAGRLHACGRLMVSAHPDQPVAHLVLSRAYKQLAKNGWRPIRDPAAIERNTKLALKEARQALRLDPQNARARDEVANLKGRLDGLLAPQPATAPENSSVRSASRR